MTIQIPVTGSFPSFISDRMWVQNAHVFSSCHIGVCPCGEGATLSSCLPTSCKQATLPDGCAWSRSHTKGLVLLLLDGGCYMQHGQLWEAAVPADTRMTCRCAPGKVEGCPVSPCKDHYLQAVQTAALARTHMNVHVLHSEVCGASVSAVTAAETHDALLARDTRADRRHVCRPVERCQAMHAALQCPANGAAFMRLEGTVLYVHLPKMSKQCICYKTYEDTSFEVWRESASARASSRCKTSAQIQRSKVYSCTFTF
jgi:hypothetical protein